MAPPRAEISVAPSPRPVLLLAFLFAAIPFGAEASRLASAPRRAPAEARRSVVEIASMKRLVERGLLEYAPREAAAPAYDEFGGELAVGTRDGHLHLFEGSGREIWKVRLGSAPTGPALFTETSIFVGTANGLLFSLDRFDGAVLWSSQLRAQVLMPMVEEGGTLVVGTNRDEVHAIDPETGETIWVYRRSVPRDLSVRGGVGVTVEGDRVFAGFSDGGLTALGLEDGRILWEVATTAGTARRFPDADAVPVVRDGTVYTTVFNDGVYAFDARTGAIRWRQDAQGAHSLTLHEDLLLVGGARQALALQAETGAPVWSLPLGASYVQRPVVLRRIAFLAGPQGLRMVEARTGRPLEIFQPGSGFDAPVVAARDRVFALSNLGILYELRPVVERSP